MHKPQSWLVRIQASTQSPKNQQQPGRQFALLLASLGLLLVCLLPACGKQPQLAPGAFTPMDKPAEQTLWELPKLTGDKIPEGKFIALFWASWCPTCRAEHAYLLSLHGQVPLVGIAFRDTTDDALAVLANQGNPFVALLNDPDGKLAQQLGVISTPTALVMDAHHHWRARLVGGINRRRWEQQGLHTWFTRL